jgi:hypothetical protein
MDDTLYVSDVYNKRVQTFRYRHGTGKGGTLYRIPSPPHETVGREDRKKVL